MQQHMHVQYTVEATSSAWKTIRRWEGETASLISILRAIHFGQSTRGTENFKTKGDSELINNIAQRAFR